MVYDEMNVFVKLELTAFFNIHTFLLKYQLFATTINIVLICIQLLGIL